MLLTLNKRLLLFFCIAILCFVVVSVLSAIILNITGPTTPAMRIFAVLQDVLVFIIPAVATALLVTRRPASLLCIDKRPPLSPLLLALCTLIVSIPAMNFIIWLNTNIPLPESVAQYCESAELAAQAAVEKLCGPHDVPNLLVSILIVGVFAGLSEELLFRGGLQRLLVTGGVNHHTAIWVSAAIFSLLHFQFFGFVPRMLLGAFFGYCLFWTKSLWVPIILHTVNNTLYIISQWFANGNPDDSAIDTIGQGSDFLIVAVSVVLTVLGLWLVCFRSSRE